MKIIVAGATGLVGGHLIEYANQQESIEKIVCVGRKEIRTREKISSVVAPFDDVLRLESEIKSKHLQFDMGFCALGTTIKTAGTREAFRKVDFEYVVHFAKVCKNLGVTRFGVVSAMGSDLNSWSFYLRVKGEMEEALKDIGFEHLVIARPSLLLGQRGEFRLGEAVAQTLNPLLKWAYKGPLAQVKPVLASDVAKTLLEAALKTPKKVCELSEF